MSDLISRSKLINDIATYFFSDKFNLDRLGRDLREIINNQTIAYDIDKVVEELETDSSVKLYGSQNSDNYMIPVKRAIEIVKHVGVADDVCEWKQTSTARYKTSCGYKLEEYFDTNACYCKQCGKKIKVVE